MGRSESKFYGERSRPTEAGDRPPELDLAGAAALAGLVEEIELLRALIKRAVQTNQNEEARRLVLALCGALRLQRILAGEPVGDLRQLFDRLLDEVGLEQTTVPAEASS